MSLLFWFVSMVICFHRLIIPQYYNIWGRQHRKKHFFLLFWAKTFKSWTHIFSVIGLYMLLTNLPVWPIDQKLLQISTWKRDFLFVYIAQKPQARAFTFLFLRRFSVLSLMSCVSRIRCHNCCRIDALSSVTYIVNRSTSICHCLFDCLTVPRFFHIQCSVHANCPSADIRIPHRRKAYTMNSWPNNVLVCCACSCNHQ